jgi:hypothetical protein
MGTRILNTTNNTINNIKYTKHVSNITIEQSAYNTINNAELYNSTVYAINNQVSSYLNANNITIYNTQNNALNINS